MRAKAPVAVIPPKKGAITLPKPCPTNSALGSCLVAVKESPTTAHNKDSIAPNKANVKAAGKSALNNSQLKPKGSPCALGKFHGHSKDGATGGIPRPLASPNCQVNWSPKKTTSKLGNQLEAIKARLVAAIKAGKCPGTGVFKRGQSNKTAIVVNPTNKSPQLIALNCCAKLAILIKKWALLSRLTKPKKSLNCKLAITTAIPAVKPKVTGAGTN